MAGFFGPSPFAWGGQPSQRGAKAAPQRTPTINPRTGFPTTPGGQRSGLLGKALKAAPGTRMGVQSGPIINRPGGNPALPGGGGSPAGQAQQQPASPPSQPVAQPSPLDAQYFSNVSGNQFKVNNQLNSLGLQGSQAGTSLQDNLARLAQQQAQNVTRAEESENAAGGFALGHLGQTLGNVNTAALQNEQGLNRNYQNLISKISNQESALKAGVPIYNNQQFLAASGRASASAAKDTSLGQNVPGAAGGSAAGGGAAGAAGGTHRSQAPPVLIRKAAQPLSRGSQPTVRGPKFAATPGPKTRLVGKPLKAPKGLRLGVQKGHN